MIDNLSATLSQIRGEIMHEFSWIEYYVHSALDCFLESQPKRPLNKYKTQLGRYLNSTEHRQIRAEHRKIERQMRLNSPASRSFPRINRPKLNSPKELNPKVLENPDVQRMDAELLVAGDRRSFDDCLKQLLEAAEKANFPKMVELRSLTKDIEKSARDRKLLTHSVWIDQQGVIFVLNYHDYHERKWMLIDKDFQRRRPQPPPKWTFQKLQNVKADLHDLSQRLMNLFQNQE
jgi:hypothetical protein